ncbi:hypothetical protein DXG01_009767 [Tephrocybe rancida]|nr:hypothetical protein DXG01_009767 [Tephrocybe rancida]
MLLLIGVRLGIGGVNLIYYETLKARNPPEDPSRTKHLQRDDAGGLRGHASELRRDEVALVCAHGLLDVLVPSAAVAVATAAGALTSSESAASSDSGARHHTKAHPTTAASRSPSIQHSQISTPTPTADLGRRAPASSESELRMAPGLDPLQDFYVSAYPVVELRTFHCERVRKMPLSGLDPSMLIVFLCKDEADWEDFRRRLGSMGQESISEPDPDDLLVDMEMKDEDDERDDDDDDGNGEQFFETRSAVGIDV